MPEFEGRLGDEMRGKWEGGKNDLMIEMVEKDRKRRETRKDSMTFHPR
jgi:hypothetical protein